MIYSVSHAVRCSARFSLDRLHASAPLSKVEVISGGVIAAISGGTKRNIGASQVNAQHTPGYMFDTGSYF